MRRYLISIVIATASLIAVPTVRAGEPGGEPGRDEIIYHFMPIAWRDSNNDPQRFGDFGGMTASLDYLQALGVSAVWMNPIFPSPAYHGYQHGPADQLNPRFGTEAQFLAFVQAAHERGIKVFIDFVVYGISHNSTWFQSAYGNPQSPYDNWLAFTNAQNTQYLGSTYTTWNGASVGFIHWNLNTTSPRELVFQWSRRWLDPNQDGDLSDGVDGYRLDHVWLNYPSGPNGWGYNLDDFWIPWKQSLQTVNPSVFTFAEQADWGTDGVELLPAHDATMTKPFEFAARNALANENAGGLYNQMAATLAAVPPGKTLMAIIGDHDVDRLASAIGGGLSKGRAAAAVLLTQPFPPMIYYGDEIGMRGTKNTGYPGDAADIPMREPFKWNAVAGPPMSNYFVLNAPAYNGRVSQNNDGRSVEEQTGVSGSLLETYRALIAARRGSVALRRGGYAAVAASHSAIWAFVRNHAEQQVLVAINVSGATRNFTLNLAAYEIPGGSTTPTDLVDGVSLSAITTANRGAYAISLPPYGFRVVDVDLVVPPPPPNAIDGRLIPSDLGPAALRATQDNHTGLGDNQSELNQLFVRPDASGLRIGLTGNLATNGTGLALLVDTTAGGQNELDLSNTAPPPGGPNLLTGTLLDSGFAPDHLLFVNAASANVYVDQYRLLTAGGVVKTYRGRGTVGDGDGFLTGGSNPNGMQVALDNSNTAGVTGTSAAAADTATTGFEMLLPFADIDLNAGRGATFRVAAFLMQSNGVVSNQWLPGLGGGYGNLGPSPDMTAIPGLQFVTIGFPQRGDANCDGRIDFFDIDAFLAALFDPPAYAATYCDGDAAQVDVDCSGTVDFFDIDPFVACLFDTCSACP